MTKRTPLLEVAIVLAACFGTPMVRSLLSVTLHCNLRFSDAWLYRTIAYEIVIGAIMVLFLRRRGWCFRDLAPDRLNAESIGLGVFASLLLFLAYAVIVLILSGTIGNWIAGPGIADQTTPLGFAPVIMTSLINPLFEETFVCAYVISAFERRGGNHWTGVHVSVAVRLIYHLYQGTVGVVMMVPVGLLFAVWYLKTRRLWPVVSAHVVFDLFPLLARTM